MTNLLLRNSRLPDTGHRAGDGTVTLGVIIGVIWDCHTFDGGKVNYYDGT